MTLAARKAARSIARDFGEINQLQSSKKGTDNFIKNTNKKVQKNLIEELVKSRPEWSMLLKENNLKKGRDENYTWIIDPLDGKINISHGIPHFCISIAVKNQKEVIAGVIYDPLKDEMFVSEKGSGSFMNDKRLRVSARKSFKSSVFSNNFKNDNFHTNKKIFEQLDSLTEEKAEIRFLGASALDLAYVAAGRFDGLWHNYLDICKIAAGSLIVSEAGGIVDTQEIKSGDFNKKNIVASNSELHRKFLSILG